MNKMKQYKVLQWAFSFLEAHGRPQQGAEILFQHVAKQSRTDFFLSMRKEVDPATVERFRALVERHAKEGVPIQHLVGSAPFYGRDFYVNSDVLIPRFETEELVERSLQTIRTSLRGEDSPLLVADLGTGSGVIAITLALEEAELRVYATDLSPEALSVAEKNAKAQGAEVRFYEGDFLRPLIEEGINPHLIVSNPPYIAYAEAPTLADTVRKYDPALALFADKEGLAAYERILDQVKELKPRPSRHILFEIGATQAQAVEALILERFPHSQVDVYQDINGKDRIVHAQV